MSYNYVWHDDDDDNDDNSRDDDSDDTAEHEYALVAWNSMLITFSKFWAFAVEMKSFVTVFFKFFIQQSLF